MGRYGYPNVNVGPLVTPYGFEGIPDTTEAWFGLSPEDIITSRSHLYRGNSKVNVRRANQAQLRVLNASQEIAMSSRPVDIEMELVRPVPTISIPQLDSFVQPMGPAVEPRKINIASNPVVPRKVDRLVSDTDAKSTTALRELRGSVSIEHLQRLLSAGLLGQRKKRRLVPTRWSITAVDDTLGKQIAEEVRVMPQLGQVELYHKKYIGNDIWIILIPDMWSFEMLETWMQGAFWARETVTARDGEGFMGRKTYASNITGAYYSARLAVLEKLEQKRRQASVVVYREISDEYFAPLGVWVIRETTRAALKEKPIIFNRAVEAADYITKNVKNKQWSTASEQLSKKNRQASLEEFL